MTWWAVPFIAAHRVVLTLVANLHTRVVAVIMPNTKHMASNWKDYRRTVKEIEAITGYDFLSVLPNNIENILEAKRDRRR